MLRKILLPILIFVLIIAVVLAVYKVLNPKNPEVVAKGNYIEAVFLAGNLRPEVASAIKIGDTIYDETGKKCFTVMDVKVQPAEEYNIDSNGHFVVEGHPVLKDVYITAKSLDKKYAWSYQYGRYQIMAGAHVPVYGEDWKVWTTVIKVKEVK